VRNAGRLFATPLFLVLLVVEITDVTLAVDSILPRCSELRATLLLSIRQMCSPFSGFERSTFCWRGVIDRLHFLDEGLAIVLVFIGGKMIGERWVHIPVTVSLGVVGECC